MRTLRSLPAAAALAGCLAAALPAAAAAPSLRALDAGRAASAYAAMQRAFYRPATSEYAGTAPVVGRPYSLVWPFSQALAATLALREAPGGAVYAPALRDRLAGLRRYWAAGAGVPAYAEYPVAPHTRGGTRYYDDNDWLGLSLVGAARALRDPALLSQARRAFRFVRSGWDGRPSDACPGGVYFVASRLTRYRPATSSAPAAELGAALFLATGDRRALAFAERAYAWTDRCLRDAGGLYADHIDPNGTVEPTRWSYNQGSMIAAGVLLARATGQARYLREARRTALATLSYARHPPARELPYLMAIYFDDLRLLDAVRPDPRFRPVAQAYADTAWRTARDARSGLFHFAPRGFTQLLEQAAVVRLEATLAAWPVR